MDSLSSRGSFNVFPRNPQPKVNSTFSKGGRTLNSPISCTMVTNARVHLNFGPVLLS